MAGPHEPKQVALLIETSNEYARGLLDGIIEYHKEFQHWTITFTEQQRGAIPPKWLEGWKGDGLIARIENENIAEAVRRLNVPAIDVSAARHIPELPWIETDDMAISRLAIDHLYDRGFRTFAFAGCEQFAWSHLREQSFVRQLQQDGITCQIFRTKTNVFTESDWSTEQDKLADWLRKLPKPIGIFCCYDLQAQRILNLLRSMHVNVPDDVAVIGVDNDPIVCELSSPPMTSIIPHARRAGYLAAELLERCMNGEPIGERESRLVKPLGIQARQSTDVLAIEDKELIPGIRYIRQFACQGISVQDVLKHVPLTRRVFEIRFRKLFGRSPSQEIIRLRMDKAKHLLAESEMSIAEIANAIGFEHVEYLSVAFKREVGMPPGQFRRNARLNSSRLVSESEDH